LNGRDFRNPDKGEMAQGRRKREKSGQKHKSTQIKRK
jgi:hypothetical protein